jgi:hypothetical protein
MQQETSQVAWVSSRIADVADDVEFFLACDDADEEQRRDEKPVQYPQHYV